MPLNLLQHKSWHVGSAKNQERVRRDERAAQLREEEEERRMQLADAEHRLRLLRERAGHDSQAVSLHIDDETPMSTNTTTTTVDGGIAATTEWGRRESRKRRREEHDQPAVKDSGMSRDISIVGADGHINLFPEGQSQRPSRNAEYAADKKRQEDALEAQYTMRLQRPSEPWYSAADGVAEADRGKDERERKREERVERRAREEGDPMNAMRRGLARLREVREDAADERRRRDRQVGLGVSHHHTHHRHRERHRERRRSRSRSRSRNRDRSRSPRGNRDGEKGVVERLRAERDAREAAERARADAVVAGELAARRPERWMASAAGGRGRYSGQFQH